MWDTVWRAPEGESIAVVDMAPCNPGTPTCPVTAEAKLTILHQTLELVHFANLNLAARDVID